MGLQDKALKANGLSRACGKCKLAAPQRLLRSARMPSLKVTRKATDRIRGIKNRRFPQSFTMQERMLVERIYLYSSVMYVVMRMQHSLSA